MRNLKTDRRSRYTRDVIKQELIKSLSNKPLNKIGVTELCAAADINRGTFYNHFYDVFDVYESIETDFFDEIKQKLSGINIKDVAQPFYKELMLFIYQNAALVNLILSNKSGSDFLKRVIDYAKDMFVLKSSAGASNGITGQVFSFIVNGSIGVIADWASEGMTQPLDEIANKIASLNSAVLLHLSD